jgi:hypothetical protein
MDDVSRAADLKSRKALCGLIAIAVFAVTEVIFMIRYDWGLVLGFVPALALAAAFGWVSFRFIWVGVAIAALFELVMLLSP